MTVLEMLDKKKILILGFGREGKSTLKFLRKYFPDKTIGVADKEKKDIKDVLLETYFAADYLKELKTYDIIFKSAGISPFISPIITAKKTGKEFSSNTALFFQLCPGRVIGITGTKGKSTASSLIYEVMKKNFPDVRLTGNIGSPPLDSLANATKETIFVAELSSHQLMDIKKSPNIAVLLNIFREHMDYYHRFASYIEAKKNITRFQTEDDILIYNSGYPILQKIASESKAKKIQFDSTSLAIAKITLSDSVKGEFNKLNALPAILIGRLFGISEGAIYETVRNFKSLPHRLEFVGSFNRVSFFNDSLATVPEATTAALSAFPKNKVVLIAGGFDRGQDYSNLAQAIVDYEVKGLVLLPTTGQRLLEDVKKINQHAYSAKYAFVQSMNEAVEEAVRLARANDTVLLSPASASFSTFKNYQDRGNQFKQAVSKIMERKVINDH